MDQEAFKLDRAIDPSQLDVEAVRQADVFFRWAKKLEKAKYAAAIADAHRKQIDAMLSRKIRKTPNIYGLKTATEKAVDEIVLLDPEYVKALGEKHEADLEMGLLEQAVWSLTQKKAMIEELIKLHGQEYFAGPSVPRNLVEAWRDYQTERGEEVLNEQLSRQRVRGKK
jgi:hypothetical protein